MHWEDVPTLFLCFHNNKWSTEYIYFSISLCAPAILTRVWCIQFYDHLIFLQISLIFVINRCWYIITSTFDNFPLRSVWNTSSVSIVYEQPSYLQGWNHLWKQTVQGCFISSFIININILGRLYHLICYVDRGIFVLIMSFLEFQKA